MNDQKNKQELDSTVFDISNIGFKTLAEDAPVTLWLTDTNGKIFHQ